MTQKTILITGSTDGIGLATAHMLVEQGHHVLLHGRNAEKLEQVKTALIKESGQSNIDSYVADLSNMHDVVSLAQAVLEKHKSLDVLINNAGVYNAPELVTPDGLDIRFAVNTLAPYLLTQRLVPLLGTSGRVINLSSAAQSAVNPDALVGKVTLSDFEAYAQSKLAITMWSRFMAVELKGSGPAIIAVNPGSMLGSKMVKDAFGVTGNDIRIGAEILMRAALSDEFQSASGQYFDNDSGRFSSPHKDALDAQKTEQIVNLVKKVLAKISGDG